MMRAGANHRYSWNPARFGRDLARVFSVPLSQLQTGYKIGIPEYSLHSPLLRFAVVQAIKSYS